MGSKPERMTASGVSSIIRSIPVRFSKARILRPSRPIMRPFISSLGSATTETVLSTAWSAATRWMASVIISRARVSASSLASASISLIIVAISTWTSLLTSCKSLSLACSEVKPEILSNSASCSCSNAWIFSRWESNSISFWCSLLSLRSMPSSFLSKESSFWTKRCSIWFNSLRRALASSSALLRIWKISSLASKSASFFCDSASLAASSSILSIVPLAAPNLASIILR